MCVYALSSLWVREKHNTCAGVCLELILVSVYDSACVFVDVCVWELVPVPIKPSPPACVKTNTSIPRIKASLERCLTRTTVNWSLQCCYTHTHTHTWATGLHMRTHNSPHKTKSVLLFHFQPPTLPVPPGEFPHCSLFISSLPAEVEHLLFSDISLSLFLLLFSFFLYAFNTCVRLWLSSGGVPGAVQPGSPAVGWNTS